MENIEEFKPEQVWQFILKVAHELQETKIILEKSSLDTKLMFQETDRKFQETDRKFQETKEVLAKSSLETDKFIKRLGKEIGGVGKSIGNLAEGLAEPSINDELEKKFKVEFIAPNIIKKIKGEKIELDILAYSNSTKNEVFIVEIKSNLSLDAINQLKNNLRRFKRFFPEHSDKKVYGIICAIKSYPNLIKEIYENGLYFATVKKGIFRIEDKKDFIPKEW
jgi:hypothetical protein